MADEVYIQQDEFFIRQNGQQSGPHSLGELKTMWHTGVIRVDAEYMRVGTGYWNNINGFRRVVDSDPPSVKASKPNHPFQKPLTTSQSCGLLAIFGVLLFILPKSKPVPDAPPTPAPVASSTPAPLISTPNTEKDKRFRAGIDKVLIDHDGGPAKHRAKERAEAARKKGINGRFGDEQRKRIFWDSSQAEWDAQLKADKENPELPFPSPNWSERDAERNQKIVADQEKFNERNQKQVAQRWGLSRAELETISTEGVEKEWPSATNKP